MPIALRVFQRLLLALYRKRVTLLIVLLLAIGGSGYLVFRNTFLHEAAAAGVFPIEVAVQQVTPQNNAVVVTLKEKNGNRRIALNVASDAEARVIAQERGLRVQGDQPQAYDLLRNVIQSLGGRVDRIMIHNADQTRYYAQVVLSSNGEPHTIQARPADAVALALKTGAPIFVEDRVLEQFGVRGNS